MSALFFSLQLPRLLVPAGVAVPGRAAGCDGELALSLEKAPAQASTAIGPGYVSGWCFGKMGIFVRLRRKGFCPAALIM